MNKLFRVFTIVMIAVVFGLVASNAQAPKKAPDYKISKIKLVPFNEQTGTFEDELDEAGTRSFFNDLSTSLFVTFEVNGQAGSFEAGRKAVVTVTEGKRVKLTKTEQVGLIGDGGKYYMPVWLYGSMCSEIEISVRLIGQKTVSTKTRTVQFACGE